MQRDEEGRALWKISAGEVDLNEASRRASVRSGSVTVFQGGQESLRVEAPSLDANAQTRRLFAQGGIVASSETNGTKFRAGKITVDLRQNRVRATGGIKGSNRNGTFRADVLESDVKFTRVRLSGPRGVRGVIGVLPENSRQ